MTKEPTAVRVAKIAAWVGVLSALLPVIATITIAVVTHRDDQQRIREGQTTIIENQRKIGELQSQVETLRGQYEWQWAGSRWLSTVDISNENGQLIGHLHMKQFCGKGAHLLPKGEGTGPIYQDGDGLRLEMTTDISNYDSQCKFTYTSHPALSAKLKPVTAYAGVVAYKDGGKSEDGDLVLVRYISTLHYNAD